MVPLQVMHYQYPTVGMAANGDARRCYTALPGSTHDTNRRNPNAEGTTDCGVVRYLWSVRCVLCCAAAGSLCLRAVCGGLVPCADPGTKRLSLH